MKKSFLIPLLILISFIAKAQVPAVNDTTRYGTNLPVFTPQWNWAMYQGYRLPYMLNSALGKTDLIPTAKYLRAFYLNRADTAKNFRIANNLSESTNFPQLRTNIGLGSASDVTFKSLSYTLMTHLATPASYFLTLDVGGKTVERTTDDVLSDIGALKLNGGNANADVNIHNNSFVTSKGMQMDTTVAGVESYFNMERGDFGAEFIKSGTYNGNFYLSGLEATMGYYHTSLGSRGYFFSANSDLMYMKMYGRTPSTDITFQIDTLNGATVHDNINNRGIVNAADYSANFTNESLVTKRWVSANYINQGTSPVNQSFNLGTGSGEASEYIVNGASGASKDLQYWTSGIIRWDLFSDNEAETGGNAGSNFVLDGFSDDGMTAIHVFSIQRSTGILDFKHTPTVLGSNVLTAITGAPATGSTNYLPFSAGSSNPLTSALFTDGASVTSSANQTNVSAFTSNGLRINGNNSGASQDAITYQGYTSGSGGAAIAFRRGTGYDTYIDWYTNNTSTLGAITRQMTLDNAGNLNLLNGGFTGANITSTVAGGENITLQKAGGAAIGFYSTGGTPQTWQLSGESPSFKIYDITAGTTPFQLDKTTGNLTILGSVTAASVRGAPVTFANVPASPTEGMLVTITDSNTSTIGATIAGGGANHVLAYYNGTNWTVTGK